jgi:hypothetical protein
MPRGRRLICILMLVDRVARLSQLFDLIGRGEGADGIAGVGSVADSMIEHRDPIFIGQIAHRRCR